MNEVTYDEDVKWHQINVILDLGRLGWDFIETMRDLLYKPAYPEAYVYPLVMETYTYILRDLVRLLDLEPKDAIERLMVFPTLESVSTLVTSTDVEVTALNALCQTHAVGIYLKLISQLTVDPMTVRRHFQSQVGYDYVIVTIQTPDR